MTEAQPDPVSRPNSARNGPPHFAQLHLVNAGLEKDAHPRECYSRQFSVTPDRQTPESQRTPRIIWPDPDPIEDLKEAKAWAANEAKRLEKFYAGRVLLRKEEPEQHGIFGEDSEYWDSQTDHWKTEYEKLAQEYDRRKHLEAEGKADKGYAEALVLSPIQSPSSPPSNGILRPTAARVKEHKPVATRSSQQPVTKSPFQNLKKRSSIDRSSHSSVSDPEYEPITRPNSAIDGFPSFCQVQYVNEGLEKNPYPMQPSATIRSQTHKRGPHPQQLTPDHSSDSITGVTKSRKRSRAELGRQEEDERNLDQARLTKRRRTEMTEPTPKHKPDPAVRTARESQRRDRKTSKASTKGATSTSQNPRVLPWDLRPRDVVSYRESDETAALKTVVSKQTRS